MTFAAVTANPIRSTPAAATLAPTTTRMSRTLANTVAALLRSRIGRGTGVATTALLSVSLLGAAARPAPLQPKRQPAAAAARNLPAIAAARTPAPAAADWSDLVEEDAAEPAAYTIKAEPAAPAAAAATELLKPSAPALAAPSRSFRKVRTIRMEVTAYCACRKCCGPAAQGLTASGKPVSHNRGRFVAADTGLLPFGTKLVIPGYDNGRPVEVLDRGGAIKGRKLDVYFHSHQEALEWGRQKLTVTVVE